MKLLQLLACLIAVVLCRDGVWKRWKEGQRVYYYENESKEFFLPAARFCREKDSQLVVINSRQENQWIWANRRSGKHYWIGFVYDKHASGSHKYQWLDGSSYVYNNWHNEPSNHEGESRLGIIRSDRSGQWNTEWLHRQDYAWTVRSQEKNKPKKIKSLVPTFGRVLVFICHNVDQQ